MTGCMYQNSCGRCTKNVNFSVCSYTSFKMIQKQHKHTEPSLPPLSLMLYVEAIGKPHCFYWKYVQMRALVATLARLLHAVLRLGSGLLAGPPASALSPAASSWHSAQEPDWLSPNLSKTSRCPRCHSEPSAGSSFHSEEMTWSFWPPPPPPISPSLLWELPPQGSQLCPGTPQARSCLRAFAPAVSSSPA